jgi:hypothetical protein
MCRLLLAEVDDFSSSPILGCKMMMISKKKSSKSSSSIGHQEKRHQIHFPLSLSINKNGTPQPAEDEQSERRTISSKIHGTTR